MLEGRTGGRSIPSSTLESSVCLHTYSSACCLSVVVVCYVEFRHADVISILHHPSRSVQQNICSAARSTHPSTRPSTPHPACHAVERSVVVRSSHSVAMRWVLSTNPWTTDCGVPCRIVINSFCGDWHAFVCSVAQAMNLVRRCELKTLCGAVELASCRLAFYGILAGNHIRIIYTHVRLYIHVHTRCTCTDRHMYTCKHTHVHTQRHAASKHVLQSAARPLQQRACGM